MAGGWPLGLDVCHGNDNGTVTSSSSGTVITAASSANTKGSYTQLVASTAYDACWMIIQMTFGTYTGLSALQAIDIATGASGSEVVLISNIMQYSGDSILFCNNIVVPCCIPAGTRIAARMQATTASNTAAVNIVLFDGAYTQMEGCSLIDTYGFVSANTTGTVITTSGTANTKGSYVQLTASTTYDLLGFFFIIDNDAKTSGGTSNYLIDVATGASGSEVVIFPNFKVRALDQGFQPSYSGFCPVAIPAGTRIAARAAGASGGTSVPIGITFYGVRA